MMRKIGLSAVLLFLCSLNIAAQGKYKIIGTVSGIKNTTLYCTVGSGIETLKIIDGQFTIEKEMDDPVLSVYFLKDSQFTANTNTTNSVSFFIEPGVMNLNIDYMDFSNSKLTGTKSQDDAVRLKVMTNEISAQYKKEQQAYDIKNAEFIKAVQSHASEQELEKQKDLLNDLREKLAPMHEASSKIALQFIKDNPMSYVSMYQMLFLMRGMSYNEAQEIYKNFNPIYQKTPLSKKLLKDIEAKKQGVPGALAGGFNTLDINGKPLQLADFKGKYLLIDFWASWCVPCRKGSPHLLEQYNKYHDKGLEILGISDDDSNPEGWRKAVEKDMTSVWHHVLRGYDKNFDRNKVNLNDISSGYNIHSLPTKILIDQQGIIIGRYDGGLDSDKDLDQKLAEIFGL